MIYDALLSNEWGPPVKNERIKVILFIDSLGVGGAQRQVVETARNLDKVRFDASIVIYHDIRELAGDVHEAHVPIALIRKNAKIDPLFLYRLWSFLRKNRPDILHSYLKTPNLWARVAGRLAAVPCIITSERNVDLAQSRWRILAERLLFRLSSRIIVNAEPIREMLVDVVGVNADRISVVYNGVDTHRFGAASKGRTDRLRTALGLERGQFVVTLPARVEPQKNHPCAIRALSRLPPSVRESICMLFVGSQTDGDYLAEINSLITALGLAKQVRLVGRQDDMAAVYALSDICILPSLWEGFPNVVLEAMACSKAVIVSDIADNRRLVEHGTTGYLFPSDDDAALAACLEDAFTKGRNHLNALGAEGQRSVRAGYSMESLIRSTEEIYRELVSSALG